MSRSYRYVEPIRAYRYWREETPLHVQMNWAADSNPPSSFRRKWRKELRNRIKQQILRCTDWDEASLETRISRLTSLYDWY